MSKLTMESALTIQSNNLSKWKQVLKHDFYVQVVAYVLEKNQELFKQKNPDPYKVFRGQYITEVISNRGDFNTKFTI